MLTLPPLVVTVIFPVMVPTGTVTVIWLSVLTTKAAIFPPPNVTPVVCVRPVPVRITALPTGPAAGLRAVSVGNCWKAFRVCGLPLAVVTLISPVAAPAGTTAVRLVLAVPEKLAPTPYIGYTGSADHFAQESDLYVGLCGLRDQRAKARSIGIEAVEPLKADSCFTKNEIANQFRYSRLSGSVKPKLKYHGLSSTPPALMKLLNVFVVKL